jgi:hypothetical protein
MSLRPVGIDEFLGGADKGGLLLRRQGQQIGSGQCPRRLDPHRADRIAK